MKKFILGFIAITFLVTYVLAVVEAQDLVKGCAEAKEAKAGCALVNNDIGTIRNTQTVNRDDTPTANLTANPPRVVSPDKVGLGLSLILSTVGNMVSGVAVILLSIPSTRAVFTTRLRRRESIVPRNFDIAEAIQWAYVIVWVGAGMYAFYYGVMSNSGVLPQFTEIGLRWWGSAAAAVAGYLGLQETPTGYRFFGLSLK